MARRGGKAARRQTRQKRTQRTQRAARPQPATQPRPPTPSETSAGPAATATTASPRETQPAGRAPAPAPLVRATPSGSSRLSERYRDQYRYVERDLRMIAILTFAILLVLAAATVMFTALDLRPS